MLYFSCRGLFQVLAYRGGHGSGHVVALAGRWPPELQGLGSGLGFRDIGLGGLGFRVSGT